MARSSSKQCGPASRGRSPVSVTHVHAARSRLGTTTALAPQGVACPGHSFAAVGIRQSAPVHLAHLVAVRGKQTLHRKPASKTVGFLHKVKKGETVAGLAGIYGVAASDIMRWNRDQLGALQPGWTLTLPSNPKGASVHKIEKGEYLWSIAKLYVGAGDLHQVNLFVNAMLVANIDLLASKNLKAGATIKIASDGKKDDGKKDDDKKDDDKKDDDKKDGGKKDGGNRGVDAGIPITIKSGTQPVKFKDLAFDLDWTLEGKVATNRGAAVEIDPGGLKVKLQQLVGSDLEVGLSKEGKPTISGGLKSRLGTVKVGLEGKNLVSEYEPFDLPFQYKGGSFKGTITLKIVAKPKVSTLSLIKRASRGKVRKYVAKLLLRRFGIKLAARGGVMAVLAAIDGPLPFGELIDLGITIWTAIELIMEISEIMKQAEGCAYREALTGGDVSCD